MKTTRKRAARAPNGRKPVARTADSLDSHVTSFAEQVGRLVGTVAGKADGWMESRAFHQQLAAVRDSAALLLRQVAGRDAKAPPTEAPVTGPTRATAAAARATGAGTARRRSRGKVDAPGKKHRGPLPSDPGATTVASQSAKLRVARPMAKTSRLRGRG